MKKVQPIDVAIHQLQEHIAQSRAVLAELVAVRAKQRRRVGKKTTVKLVHPVTGKTVTLSARAKR
jgi:hypothetical protein